MNVQINIESLQSFIVEERCSEFITNAVMEILNQSDLFSATFEIEKLKFGTKQPKLQLISMKDVDVTLQWHLNTHEFLIPLLRDSNLSNIRSLEFQAPFQAVLDIQCDTDCSLAFMATLSIDVISPGSIKFPINATISKLKLLGQLTIQYLGDSIILFFDRLPVFDFELDLVLGADEKIFDQIEVRNFLFETMQGWIQKTLVHPNAIKLPISVPSSASQSVILD